MEYCAVQINPLDYGAYGKLKVEVNVCGLWYPAHVKGGTKEYIDIPRDDNGNHIADHTFWDKNGASAKSDDDSIPIGDSSKGDGLSLYEEYRGFQMKGKWKATHPDIKDLFVCFDCELLNWGCFEEATGLSLHEISEKEFKDRNTRIVNFNKETAHIVDQHGIFVEFGKPKREDSAGVAVPLRSPIRSPGDALKVIMDYTHRETDVPHELGHCVGIRHHGDGNRNFTKWEVEHSLNPDASSEVLEVMDFLGDMDRYYLAVWQGENSGAEECFMRYDTAHFYQRRDGNIYAYPKDTKGYSLCESQEGSGYNDKQYTEKIIRLVKSGKTYEFKQVFPMCGDAVRGACKYKIHVSDKRD
jgi:hypothetical protein